MIDTGHKERTARIIAQMRRKGRDGKDGADAAIAVQPFDTTEIAKLADQIRDHFETLEGRLDTLQSRVKQLENRPLTIAPENDREVIPVAIGKLHDKVESFHDRLKALEDEPKDITPPIVDSEEVQRLELSIEDVGVAALQSLSVAVKRLDALEARMAHIKLEIVEDTLGELRKSSA